MANDKFLEELANKLNNHSSEVNPQMWSSIQSQIGTASTVGAGSASGAIGLGKIAAIVVGVTSIAVASYFALNSNKEENSKSQTIQTIETDLQNEEIKTPAKPNTFDLKEKKEVIKETSEETATLNSAQQKTKKGLDFSSSAIQTKPLELVMPMAPELILSIAENKARTSNLVVKTEAQVVVDKKEPTPQVDNIIEQIKKADAYTIQKLPNIFTPNGDGVNDYFQIESEGLQNYSLVVLDMNNKIVWQTKDPNAKWDGVDAEGNKVPKGQYVYFLAAQDTNGNPVGKHERLTVQF